MAAHMTRREEVARIIEPGAFERGTRFLEAAEMWRNRVGPDHSQNTCDFMVSQNLKSAEDEIAPALAKADAILALTAADPIPIEREGFVLVPREPTDDMLDQGIAAIDNLSPDAHDVHPGPIYHAMISAAPVLSEPPVGVEPNTKVEIWIERPPGFVSTPEQDALAAKIAVLIGQGYDHEAPALSVAYAVLAALPAPPAKPSGVGE